MKGILENYDRFFFKLNSTDKSAFELASRNYDALYGKFLPVDKNARILDVGCGIGHFLYFLKKKGYNNFFGIDMSRGQIDFIKENITKEVAVGDAFAFLGDGTMHYNLIVVNDVLQLIKKDRLMEFLSLLQSSLEQGGSVIMKTGNMSNPFGLRSRYIDISNELGFTEHSLLEVLEEAGFSDINIIGSSSPVVSFKSFIVKLGRISVHKILWLMFLVQGYPPPKILDQTLIAIVKK